MKSGTPSLPPLQSTKVLDQLRERIRYFHYSIRTEKIYVYWVRLFIRFHRLRHPLSMGKPEVEEFLSWLATTKNVAASTHKQALSALLLLSARPDLPTLRKFKSSPESCEVIGYIKPLRALRSGYGNSRRVGNLWRASTAPRQQA